MNIGSRFVRTWLTAMMVLILGALPALAHGPGEEELGVDLRVSSVSRVPKTGQLLVKGTIACEEPAEAELFAGAEQAVGRFGLVEGYGDKDGVRCGPQAKGYTLTIDAYRGKHFQGGKVAVSIDAFACSPEIPNWDEEGPGDGEMPQITCGYDFHGATMRVRTLHR